MVQDLVLLCAYSGKCLLICPQACHTVCRAGEGDVRTCGTICSDSKDDRGSQGPFLLWICLLMALAPPTRMESLDSAFDGASESFVGVPGEARAVLVLSPYSALLVIPILVLSPYEIYTLESCSSCYRTWPSKCGLNQSKLVLFPKNLLLSQILSFVVVFFF